MYYFNARWYDPELGRFITEDPVKDGVNWFAYVSNNPLNRIDPTGLREIIDDDMHGRPIFTEEEKKKDTRNRIGAYNDRINNAKSISEAAALREEQLNKMGEYNRSVLPRYLEEYGGKTSTGDFEDDYKAYKQDPHPGIDFVNSEGFKSPFYSQLTFAAPREGTSNQMVFSIIGTSMNMRLKHSDTEDVLSLQKQATSTFLGGEFSPDETIVPFPERGNPSSMKPHFHLEMNKIVDGVNKLINPIGLGVGTVDKYRFNYGTLVKPNWGGMNESFGR